MSLTKVGSFLRDCNGTTLHYEQACLQIVTSEKIKFFSQYETCEGCKLLETARLKFTNSIVVKTIDPLHYAVENDLGQICNGSYHFGEFGQYVLNITDVTMDKCLPKMTAEPDAPFLPILSAVVTLLSMATLWYIVKGIGKWIMAGSLYSRYFANEDNELGSDTNALTTDAPRLPVRSRLRSLDIFRGIAIALMIFVNAGGGGYAVFNHSVWNGLTVADVVFPWFAFAMGQSLMLSLNARLRTALPRVSVFKQVAVRSLMMSLLGICLSSVNVSWNEVRLPGVLQRLGVMYLIVGGLECAFMNTSHNIIPGHSLFRDIRAGWKQWLATLALVMIQVWTSLYAAAPGCPRGYSGPGGLHMSALYGDKLRNCTGGIAGYIDRMILGTNHLYKYGEYRKVYHTSLAYDPEGLLGILSGVLVVQAGAHATRVMLTYNHARARITRWLFWSLVFAVMSGLLSGYSMTGGVIPINKSLWSVSYCLVTSSMAFFLTALLYFFVDLKAKWGGRPLYYAGQNALFLYVGSELLKRHFPLYLAMAAPTHAQLLSAHALAVLLWLAVAVALHRKHVFITL